MLVIRLKPSKHLAFLLIVGHVGAISLLWPLDMPLAVKLGGSTLLAASLVGYLRRYAGLLSPRSIMGFELSEDMVCTVETRDGNHLPCSILGSSFVAAYLTVLELKVQEPVKLSQKILLSQSIVILPDSIDPEIFRKLRVLLRWKWNEQIN